MFNGIVMLLFGLMFLFIYELLKCSRKAPKEPEYAQARIIKKFTDYDCTRFYLEFERYGNIIQATAYHYNVPKGLFKVGDVVEIRYSKKVRDVQVVDIMHDMIPKYDKVLEYAKIPLVVSIICALLSAYFFIGSFL